MSEVVAVLKDKSVDVGRNNNETAVGNDAAHRSFHGECSGGRSATLRQSRRAVVLGRGRRGPHAGVALTLRCVIGVLSRTIHLVARRESRTHRGLLQQLFVSPVLVAFPLPANVTNGEEESRFRVVEVLVEQSLPTQLAIL